MNADFIYLTGRQWTDIYSSGKTLARLARIINIADELYDRDQTRYAAMLPLAASGMRDSLQIYLGKWLNGNSSALPNVAPAIRDSLLYDTKFRGIISSRSHDSLDVNNGVDFGSALYNDHHFHYGYLLYAAAVLAKKNPASLPPTAITILTARSISQGISPTPTGETFAMQRYKDWFEGNSWANGLVPYRRR